ncbi:uncharacterized [Tachysurus ichikawai]
MPHSCVAQYPVPSVSPPSLRASRRVARTLRMGDPVPLHPHLWVHTVTQHHPVALSAQEVRTEGPIMRPQIPLGPASVHRLGQLPRGGTLMQSFSFCA